MKNETLIRIGERVYSFYNQQDINEARHIYAHFTGDQNDFESAMEDAKLEFNYAIL